MGWTIDSWQDVAILVGVIVSVATGLATLGSIYYLRRKDRREAIAASLDVDEHEQKDVQLALQYKDELIQALKDDREELKNQLRLAIARNEKLEGETAALRKQLARFEAESRQMMTRLLEQFAIAERCSRSDCPNRATPSSDLTPLPDVAVGGTD